MRYRILPTRGKSPAIFVEGLERAVAVAEEAHDATGIHMLVLEAPEGGIVREVATIPAGLRRSRRGG